MNNEEMIKLIEEIEDSWKKDPTFNKKEYIDSLHGLKDYIHMEEEFEKEKKPIMESLESLLKDERMINSK